VIKVAMIGAGSVVFCKNLTGDILSHPEFRDATFSYMDVDPDRLAVGADLCRRAARALGASPRIEATRDRRQALAGADFVINMVQIGGFDSTLVDFEIPRKYGLRFTIADTTGPGGLFRALRTFPMLSGLCRDMAELCPGATLLNYANPMSMNMQTVSRTSPDVRAVGLCHSVQGTLDQLMGYLGEDPCAVAFTCAGINHMAFYLRLEKDGQDLYPRLFEAMNRPEVYDTNRVRFELMRRLGYFVTESSEHNAEYSPWFIPHGDAHARRYDVPLDEYLHRCDGIVEQFEQMRALSRCPDDGGPADVHRSHEYGSTIIHSVVTGRPSVVYGNMPNRGAIANLPATAIAEAPTLVDRAGLRFTTVGDLPPQLIAYMNPHVAQHELFIRAAIEGRRDHVYQACLFDPLTAATVPPDRVVEMCDELIAAHGFLKDGGVLPDLDAKRTLVPSSGRSFGKVDPATLRASWDAQQERCEAEHLAEWHVIGPFRGGTDGRISLDLHTPVEDAFLARGDGSLDVASRDGLNGASPAWRAARAGKRGYVDLAAALGPADWAVAYGYAEFYVPDGGPTVLRCGSDDGMRVWLNGERVHSREVGRAYKPGSDAVEVTLRPGVNRVLVKVDNYHGAWGFGLAIPNSVGTRVGAPRQAGADVVQTGA
jgi:alpha-galactosidase